MLTPSLSDFVDKLLVLELSLRQPGSVADGQGFLEKLLITVDTAPVLLSYVDSAGRYRFCNQAYERWFGEKREFIVGKAMPEVLGEAAYASIQEAVQSALSGRRVHFERVVRYRSGGSRMVRADYVPHVLPDGRVAGFVAMVEDITELRRSEQQRRAHLRVERLYAVSSALSQALLPEEVAQVAVREGASALEALSASLVLVDAEGTSFELSAAHGFPEGVLDERWRRFPLGTPLMYREAVRTGRSVLYGNLEAFLRDYPEQAGSPALLGRAFVALPLRVQGSVIGAFGFSFEHEREFSPEELQFMEALGQQCAVAIERARLYAAERQARAEAEQLRDRLAAESTLLETVLKQLPVGVVIAEPGGRLVRSSAAIETIWGHAFVPSTGISEYGAYQGYHPDGRPYAPEDWPLARSLLHGETVVREPVTIIRPDASRRQIDVSSTLVRDAAGRPVAGVVVSTDVTQHHELREALRREGEVRERLLGIVSHDLRNPLQAISTASHLLLSSLAPLTASQRKWVSRIRTSVLRMDRLIRDLLDFVRIRQGGTLPIQRQPMSLEEVGRAAVDELLAAHPQRQLLLEARGETGGEWDPERLIQLLGNLLSNALTHGAEGAPIQVRVNGEGAQVVLEVANQGIPIPPELLPRIFEPFTRASGGGNALKGVGLGLFIVHEIVAAHGGHIDVSSSREAGTVFRVRLPRVPLA
ncbi:ATP-binding protein [Archangium violaceum]|uniref:PAS domain-containing sensor histidine kinase n=1 Tax=Archangium violaceum TaxID=83451 RepID=UPI000695F3B0|nr:ATP-binding protein [Archangium violaceum]